MPSDSSWLPSLKTKQVRQNGTLYFMDEQGRRLPSVSTILNSTRSAEQRQALARWQQRLGMEEATRITSAASRRGTGAHQQIQRYLRGEVVSCSETVKPYWDSVKPVLHDLDQVQLVEGTVFHYELGYAGKVDCVARYQTIPCVCEWKTADRPRQTVDRLHDYPLQLVAYWGAVNHCYREYGLDLQHALLAIAVPDLPAEIFWFDRDAIAPYWDAWQERVALFWRRRGGYQRWNSEDF